MLYPGGDGKWEAGERVGEVRLSSLVTFPCVLVPGRRALASARVRSGVVGRA